MIETFFCAPIKKSRMIKRRVQMEGKKRKTANVRSTGKGTAAANVFSEWNTFDVSVMLGREFAAVLPHYGDAIGDDRSCLIKDEDIEKEMHRAHTRSFRSSISEPHRTIENHHPSG